MAEAEEHGQARDSPPGSAPSARRRAGAPASRSFPRAARGVRAGGRSRRAGPGTARRRSGRRARGRARASVAASRAFAQHRREVVEPVEVARRDVDAQEALAEAVGAGRAQVGDGVLEQGGVEGPPAPQLPVREPPVTWKTQPSKGVAAISATCLRMNAGSGSSQPHSMSLGRSRTRRGPGPGWPPRRGTALHRERGLDARGLRLDRRPLRVERGRVWRRGPWRRPGAPRAERSQAGTTRPRRRRAASAGARSRRSVAWATRSAVTGRPPLATKASASSGSGRVGAAGVVAAKARARATASAPQGTRGGPRPAARPRREGQGAQEREQAARSRGCGG